MGMVSACGGFSFLPLCGLEVWQVWLFLGRVHVVVDGQVLEVPQGEGLAHFAATANRSETSQGAHCGEGLGSSRYGAKNALQNDDLRAIGYCWDPKLLQFEGPPASRAWNTELATPFLHWFLILSQAARKVPI